MAAKTKSRSRLVVEGIDDLYSVVHLMSAHTEWPQDKHEAPVWIEMGNSVSEILDPTYLSVQSKAPDVDILGIMLDGDSKPRGRYDSIRSQLVSAFPGLPNDLPAEGLINDNGTKRLGVWIMPDNASEGGLETFLRYLVPDETKPLWELAVECVGKAVDMGAKCKEVHNDKARVYTFLSWHNPPGQNPGLAITKKVLDPQSPSAQTFIKWFKELYRLP